MDKFEIHFNSIKNMLHNAIKNTETRQSFLTINIKELEDDMRKHPNALSYFELVEGETYRLLSGFNHPIFKVTKKMESQDEGIPYYEVVNINEPNNSIALKQLGLIFSVYERYVAN